MGSVHSELAATRQQQRRVSAGGGGRYKCNAAAPWDLQRRSPYFSSALDPRFGIWDLNRYSIPFDTVRDHEFRSIRDTIFSGLIKTLHHCPFNYTTQLHKSLIYTNTRISGAPIFQKLGIFQLSLTASTVWGNLLIT